MEIIETGAKPLAVPGADELLAKVAPLAIDTVDSPHTRRAYRRALRDFLAWHADQGRPAITKALVNSYRRAMLDEGLSAGNVNQRLTAIRKLVTEAADNGLVPQDVAGAVARVKGVTVRGSRSGSWLTLPQAQALLAAPDVATLLGRRDRAILALMLGGALRRSEVVGLDVESIQLREERWTIPDLLGKHGRRRTVALAPWVKKAVSAWTSEAGIEDGPLFRPMRKGDNLQRGRLSVQAIYRLVARYTAEARESDENFPEVAPHDLRRTAAKLALKGKAPLEQIQLWLGHGSVATTERYLGVELDLSSESPADVLGLAI